MSNRVFSSIGSVPMSLGMIVIFSLLLICGGGGSATGHDPSGNRIIGGSTNTIYGRTIDVLDYGDLSSAIKAMGTTQTTLVISTPQILTEDTTVPPNVYLVIQNGGIITKDSSYKLTIYGPFEAGLYQVFVGFSASDVSFGPGSAKEVYPEWWGIDGTADEEQINAAISAVSLSKIPLRLSARTYNIDSTIIIPYTMSLLGSGSGSGSTTSGKAGTIIKKTSDVLGILIKSGVTSAKLEDFCLSSSLAGATTDGIQIGEADNTNGAGFNTLRNIAVEGMGGNGIHIANGNDNHLENIHTQINGIHGLLLDSVHTSGLNVNANMITNLVSIANRANGLSINKSAANTVLNAICEGNGAFGIYVNRAYNYIRGYAEGNVGGDLYAGVSAYSCFLVIRASNSTILNKNNFIYLQ